MPDSPTDRHLRPTGPHSSTAARSARHARCSSPSGSEAGSVVERLLNELRQRGLEGVETQLAYPFKHDALRLLPPTDVTCCVQKLVSLPSEASRLEAMKVLPDAR